MDRTFVRSQSTKREEILFQFCFSNVQRKIIKKRGKNTKALIGVPQNVHERLGLRMVEFFLKKNDLLLNKNIILW